MKAPAMDSKTPELSPDEIVAQLVAGTSANLLVSVLKGELYATLVALTAARKQADNLRAERDRFAESHRQCVLLLVDAGIVSFGNLHDGVAQLRAERDALKKDIERAVATSAELATQCAAWRNLAEHLQCCVECSMMSVESCPEGQPLLQTAIAAAIERG